MQHKVHLAVRESAGTVNLTGATIFFFCKQKSLLRNDRVATSMKLKCLAELAFMHSTLCYIFK